MNMKRLAVVVLALLLSAAAWAARPKPAPRVVTDWMAANAVPLATVSPGAYTADLEPFRAMIGGARVVGLGEATHGTHEFFLIKHRLFEFLVSEMGFDTLAIEDSFAEAQAINDYVLDGTGDPASALRSMGYWVWNTQEMLDMVRWMREWNADPGHARKVRFFGIDMYKWASSTAAVRAYLTQADPAFAAEADALLIRFASDATRSRYNGKRNSEKRADAAGFADLLRQFDAHHSAWAGVTGEEAWALARWHARVVGQCQSYWSTPNEKVMGNIRDESMADNVLWLRDFIGPEGRMAVWAHNGHVTGQDRSWGMTPMGVYLKGALQGDYVSVGLHFDRGSFTSKTWVNGSLSPPMTFAVGGSSDGTINQALNTVGLPLLVLDFRPVPAYPETALKWLWRFEGERWYDAVYLPSAEAAGAYAHWTMPLSSYDLVVFIRETTASTPLP
jgi:erythromycin esterase